MKHIILALSVLFLSSCSSVFYTSHHQFDDLEKSAIDSSSFSLYDEAGNLYEKAITSSLDVLTGESKMGLRIPKFSKTKKLFAGRHRISYLVARDNDSVRVYELKYKNRFLDFPILTGASLAGIGIGSAITLYGENSGRTDVSYLGEEITIISLAVCVLIAPPIELVTVILSKVHNLLLVQHLGLHKKWKFKGVIELNQSEYPDFLD